MVGTISTLFIDFDSTLCHDRFWRSLDRELLEKIQRGFFQQDTTIVRDWMRGIYTAEDVNKKAAEYLGIEYEWLWNIFVQDCRAMKVDAKVLDLLKQLRRHYKLILVTDNMDCLDRFTIPSLNLDQYFDMIVNSFNERVSKDDNDGQLFLEVMKRVGSDPAGTILIDNSEKSCARFEKLGGKAFLVSKEKPLTYWLERLV